MAVSNHNNPLSRTFERILVLLENLKSTPAGNVLYQHIERSFAELETSQQQAEHLYFNLLGQLLENLAAHFPPGTEQWMQIRILQKSLQGGMPAAELQQLQQDVQQLVGQAGVEHALGHKSVQETIDVLLADLHGAAPQPGDALTGATANLEFDIPPGRGTPPPFKPEAPYCDIDKTRNNIQQIQSSLAQQITSAKEFNSALAKLLHGSFAAIRNLDESSDVAQIKNNFLRRYAKLIKMQQDLSGKFQSIDDELNNIESTSQNLDKELSRVRRLSLTDDLTQLPNRRAFLMRLDDEISRALRFDYPLTVALIDIDNFKPINDTYGHAAGDMILRHLAQNMNVVFRYHDMASRYGGEEFAVLFPNTGTHGAMSALRKLQEGLKMDRQILFNEVEIPVPTFSAGVALYSPGEDVDELIKRADVAMYKAKSSGRDHIEVDPLGCQGGQEGEDKTTSTQAHTPA